MPSSMFSINNPSTPPRFPMTARALVFTALNPDSLLSTIRGKLNRKSAVIAMTMMNAISRTTPMTMKNVISADGSLTVLRSMSLPRSGHTAVRLADDRVLVVGGTTAISSDQGTTEAATAYSEIFSPGAYRECFISKNPQHSGDFLRLG